MGKSKAIIDNVVSGSIADELGIEKGDVLLSINGDTPDDLIDYRFQCAEEELELEIIKANGEVWTCEVEKDYDEDLGLGFSTGTFDGIKNCANKCIFCFVDQMPEGMRESLYIKDDDFRLSVLHGNFVTLTNLTKADFDRIIALRLSPLYVSVHTTNPDLRVEMLGNKRASNIMEQLKRLVQAGIELHTQIVLCPGVNDGSELEKSIEDLISLGTMIRSIAIVPVGLTRHRNNLYSLKIFSSDQAEKLICKINDYQVEFLKEFDNPIVYLADEFFVMAKKEFPEKKYYGDFPQLENGVGLVRLFYDSFNKEKARLPKIFPKKKHLALVTGTSGEYVLKPVAEQLNAIGNLSVDVIGVDNHFFGGRVSVAGLLTGQDIILALREKETEKNRTYDIVLLPSVVCKRDENIFLDGITPNQIEKELKCPVRVINIDDEAKGLIDAILE